MPVQKYSLADRFYILSTNAINPQFRVGVSPALIVMAHGYQAAGQTTIIRGVNEVRFWCRDGYAADADSVTHQISGNFDLRDWGAVPTSRYLRVAACPDYTLQKESGPKAKKEAKGKNDPNFANADYFMGLMKTGGANATQFDIACLHNTWKSGRTVKFSEFLLALNDNLDGRYARVLCGFCREPDDGQAHPSE